MRLTQINLAMPLVALGDVLHQIHIYMRRCDQEFPETHLRLLLLEQGFSQNTSMFLFHGNAIFSRPLLELANNFLLKFAYD